jgi:hypothetical protein
MIIFDFSQLLYGAVYSDMKLQGTKEPSERGIRIYILNKIQFLRERFVYEYGEETVIAIDANSWRKDTFANYKFKRKKTREEDPLDWKVINGYFNNIKKELKENFSYKVIDVSGAEGDDIVAVLSRHSVEPVLIIGQDKDYFQLHNRSDLRQYCPLRNEFISFAVKDIPYNLFNHICRGDSSDGVPSIFNYSNCFADGVRQKPLKETYIQEAFEYAMKGQVEEFLGPERFARFKENKVLIDFRSIPVNVKTSILDLYENYELPTKNVYKYLIQQNLTEEFIKEINNF